MVHETRAIERDLGDARGLGGFGNSGSDGLRRLQETFPGGTAPEIRLLRVTGSGDVWFGESRIHYADGKIFYGVSRVEFRDGKMWRETRYYAEPFEPPAWRAGWFERAGELVAG